MKAEVLILKQSVKPAEAAHGLRLRCLVFGLAVCAVSGGAGAQQVFGTLDGNVTDVSGATIAGAVVKITETNKGVVFTMKTNDSGLYSQGQLIPGNYVVHIEAPGFKQVDSTPIDVKVDAVSRFNASLPIGSSAEIIQVTDNATLLQTDRADVATTLTADQIVTLPTYQRSTLSLEFTTPGVISVPTSTPTAENPQGSFRARVNGQVWGATGYQLDGTDNQDAWLGAAIINPNPDSVAETKFSTENFDAENGYVAGGLFVASTKSGSNSLHGSLFEYLINNSPGFRTVGSNPFTQPNGAPPLKSNQFGGSLGGPIFKDKLFFFVDAQILRRREGDTLLTTVPTARVQQTCTQSAGLCDLSEYLNAGLNTIYDPATGNQNTGIGRAAFANNSIPAGRLSPQALAILKYFPLPNTTVGGVAYRNNYIASGSQSFNSQQYDTREDYYLNPSNLFFGRYSTAGFNLSVPGAFGYLAGGPGLDSNGFSGISSIRNQSLSLGYTHTFNPNLVNELRFGFYRYNVHVTTGGFGSTPAADAGIPNLNNDKTFSSGMPFFNITGDGGSELGYSLTANRCNCPLAETENEFQLNDNLTRVLGNHTLKFGTDLRRTSNLRAPSDSHRSGELTFSPGYTGVGNTNGGSTQGLGLATFLLGETTSFVRYVSSVNDATAYLKRAHFYGQDTWHPTAKLTLNYGLRWELTYPETTDPGKGGLLNLNTGNVEVFGVGGNSSAGFQKMNYTYFAPRIGIAYQLTPKTVVRGGYGWAYDIASGGSIFNSANIQLPVLVAQSNSAANASQGVFQLAGGPANLVVPSINSQGQIALPNGISENTRPTTITLPTVYAYNATIQRELTNHITLTAGYVGNSGRHTINDGNNSFNVNQAPFVPGVTNLNSIKPYYQKFGWTQAINIFCDCATSQFNSFQVSANVRALKGYTAQASYLYQDVYGDGGNTYTAYTMLYNRALGRGNDSSTPHTQVILVQDYDLPYGTGKTFGSHSGHITNAVLGGWRVSGITTYLSGSPFTVGIGTYPAGYTAPSVGPNYPDRGAGSPYDGAAHNRTQWFKGGLGGPFLLPAANTFGNYGFNNLYGPSYNNTDLALLKSATVMERYKFTLRTDAFNLFNHANLALPNTNLTDPKAGQITATATGSNMRRLQFALRLDF